MKLVGQRPRTRSPPALFRNRNNPSQSRVTLPIATAVVPAREQPAPPANTPRHSAAPANSSVAAPRGRATPEDRESQRSLFDYESVPSWLVSLITHMSLIILLGLLIKSVPADPGVELLLDYGDPGLTNFDAGGGGEGPDLSELPLAGAAEMPIETEVAPEAIGDAAADPLANVELTGLFSDAPSTESLAVDASSLLARTTSGLGDGGSGPGTGGGHGAGTGPGWGDGTGPGHAVTSMFGLAGEGGDFVYVFDRSQSMNSVLTTDIGDDRAVTVTPLEAAKNELNRSIGDLNDECRFQVVFYNDHAVAFGGKHSLSKATFSNKQLVKSFISAMPADSNTNHIAGLEQAIQCRPQIIFLLTDGEEKDDPTPSEVRSLVRDCKRLKIKVNIVHFCFDVRTTSTLTNLAHDTGGQHRFITLRELAHQKIAAERGTPTLRAVDMPPPLE